MKKYESGGKIITKLATTALKTYSYRVQKDGLEIEDSDLIKGKRVKNSASTELTYQDLVNFFTCNKSWYNKRTNKLQKLWS